MFRLEYDYIFSGLMGSELDLIDPFDGKVTDIGIGEEVLPDHPAYPLLMERFQEIALDQEYENFIDNKESEEGGTFDEKDRWSRYINKKIVRVA